MRISSEPVTESGREFSEELLQQSQATTEANEYDNINILRNTIALTENPKKSFENCLKGIIKATDVKGSINADI